MTTLIPFTYRCYTFGLKTCSHVAKGIPRWDGGGHGSGWPLGRADLVLLEKERGEEYVGKLKKYSNLRTWEKGFSWLEETSTSLKAKEKQGTVFCILQL